MDLDRLVDDVWARTRDRKLEWEATSDPDEVVAVFAERYVLRLSAPRWVSDEEKLPRLSLESANGQVIVRIPGEGGELPLRTDRLRELWESVRFGGKSAEEALSDALGQLESM